MVKNGNFGAFSVIFGQNELFGRHENFQNSLSGGPIVVLKVTVYRPTRLKKCGENKFSAIFGQKVEKTGFIPPILGGNWVSGGVGFKELNYGFYIRFCGFVAFLAKMPHKKPHTEPQKPHLKATLLFVAFCVAF